MKPDQFIFARRGKAYEIEQIVKKAYENAVIKLYRYT
jgi:hypothetical protein